MKYFFILLIFFVNNCATSKSTFICGDHKCINKTEAKQYFEENLTIEVSIKSNNKESRFDLVSLNLGEKNQNIQVYKKNNSKIIKKLTKDEIKNKKKELKSKQKNLNMKKKVKKNIKTDNLNSQKKANVVTNYNSIDNSADICLKLEKCDIDTITKYLIKVSNNKDYPNISLKE